MSKLCVMDLFSGIGGFSLGLERTGGFETVAFCEIDPFCQKVLKQHWPEVPIYEDVTKLTAEQLVSDGITVDVITGGFPCQDISTAGRLEGISTGTRSGLWSEIVRLVGDLRPRYLLVENVANLLRGPSSQRGGWFGRVLGDLAALGYNAEWENIPAGAMGAPHRRERVWILAHSSSVGQSESRQPFQPLCTETQVYREGDIVKPIRKRPKWCSEPAVDRVAYGVPDRMDRLAALGNAVVPQIPELIGYAILEAERAAA